MFDDEEYTTLALQPEHVANSPYTVLGECMSAGRLYDKIGKQAIGAIKIVTGNGIICAVSTKKKK